MMMHQDDNYIIPCIDGSKTLFPISTKINPILDDNLKCRFCNRRHIKSIPNTCQGKYDADARQGWKNDWIEYLKTDQNQDDN